MIHIIGTRMTGTVECCWNQDIIVHLDPPWCTRLARFARLPATGVEVISTGDAETEQAERQILAAARGGTDGAS